MRLLRFVAVALMVTVSVASIGCGPEAKVKPKEPATSSSPEGGSETSANSSDTAASGMTNVSLTVTGMK